MTPAAPALFILAILFAGAGGTALLLRLFRDVVDEEARLESALALGIPVGLILLGLPGWLLSAFVRIPIAAVALPFGAIAIGAALYLGFPHRPKRESLAKAWIPLAILVGVFFFYVFLRWQGRDIRHTEQPMDFAILSSLTYSDALPISDPWLSGERFSYYHFGTYLLSLPVRISGMPTEYAYNVWVALLAALASTAAFGAVRLRGGARSLGLLAAGFLVLAGTPDGARQWLTARKGLFESFETVDVWPSTRRIDHGHAISEWPLFTLWLGDLHPHCVAMPLFVALAAVAGRVAKIQGIALDALLLGSLLSANPWDLPAAGLILLAGNLAERPFVESLLRCVLTAIASVPVLFTFLRSSRPPFQGLSVFPKLDNGQPLFTTSLEGFLHYGSLAIVPALALGIALVRSEKTPERQLVLATLFPAIGIAVSIVTGRPVLGLAVGFVAGVATLVFRPPFEDEAPLPLALKSGFLLASAGALMAALPEVVVVLDSYGEENRRMNTIFKCFAAAYPLLIVGSALLLPLVLAARRASGTIRTALVFAVIVACFHPIGLLARRFDDQAKKVPGGLDGLAWLAEGDRKAIAWIRTNARPGTVVAEAPGNAYHDNSRMSAATGRPTVLGWSNHESVWRGNEVIPELDQRRDELKTIYTSPDANVVIELLKRRKVQYVVVGSIEKKDFGPDAFPARAAFKPAMEAAGTAVYEVPR